MAEIDGLTINEIRKRVANLENKERQLGEIRATLIVNCKPGRPLDKMGIEYDEAMSVAWNLQEILSKLYEQTKGD